MSENNVAQKLAFLEGYERKYLDLGKEMFEPGKVYLYKLDLLVNAVMDRALSLIFGFTSQIRANNFTCAAPLVRMHMDNLLRFYASYISDDPHDFTMRVFQGEHIRNIKDKEGKKMTDTYLVKELSKLYPWMEKVYESTSGYVHLSNIHIYNSSKIEDLKKGIIAFTVGKEDRWLDDEQKVEAIDCMSEISEVLYGYLNGWAEHKRQLFLSQ